MTTTLVSPCSKHRTILRAIAIITRSLPQIQTDPLLTLRYSRIKSYPATSAPLLVHFIKTGDHQPYYILIDGILAAINSLLTILKLNIAPLSRQVWRSTDKPPAVEDYDEPSVIQQPTQDRKSVV